MQSSIDKTILTVSKLNHAVRYLLEDSFLLVWLEGEISNLSIPSSGHMYFSLKDESAQIRCALFRMSAQKLKFQPQNGMHVLLRGKVSLYEPRGDYQFIAEHMEEAGNGALQRAFEALKNRLAAEGLFDAARKKSLPTFPKKIGVITSPTGAAIRDILSVLKRRFASIPVIIYPVLVQGTEAAGQITQAIKLANQRKECDVLILSRGGGALEDLWPFNEETVARAIYNSDLPIISGIGHEIDFTIADFVADYRAPTPSAAAELVSPNAQELAQILLKQRIRLTQNIKIFFKHIFLLLDSLKKRLPHPQRSLQHQAQQIDSLEQRLLLGFKHYIKHKTFDLTHASAKLIQYSPQHRLQLFNNQMHALELALGKAMKKNLAMRQQEIASLINALENISPLNTLKRGYAIVTQGDKVISDTASIELGETIQVRLSKGTLISVIKEKQ
ncbi:MAG: Exodeoxyribonuclease [Gammaproteobacteria bacterium]|jgi:exodeoxyribonuclease VII large subunit|nr:Exodeoxyribonuclease [Gammaproteobacteria bacterium]